jgi:hypothetical protein
MDTPYRVYVYARMQVTQAYDDRRSYATCYHVSSTHYYKDISSRLATGTHMTNKRDVRHTTGTTTYGPMDSATPCAQQQAGITDHPHTK